MPDDLIDILVLSIIPVVLILLYFFGLAYIQQEPCSNLSSLSSKDLPARCTNYFKDAK